MDGFYWARARLSGNPRFRIPTGIYGTNMAYPFATLSCKSAILELIESRLSIVFCAILCKSVLHMLPTYHMPNESESNNRITIFVRGAKVVWNLSLKDNKSGSSGFITDWTPVQRILSKNYFRPTRPRNDIWYLLCDLWNACFIK